MIFVKCSILFAELSVLVLTENLTEMVCGDFWKQDIPQETDDFSRSLVTINYIINPVISQFVIKVYTPKETINTVWCQTLGSDGDSFVMLGSQCSSLLTDDC